MRIRRRERAEVGAGAGAGRSGGPGRAGARAFTPDLVEAVIDGALSACAGRDGRALAHAVALLALGPTGSEGAAVVDRALGERLLRVV
ncbi:MAG TPA: hypothetical protein VF743_13015, partial [Acidimicrobiales bacterium]